MNIILIIVDTLRYDYIGANGNPAIQTPNIDRLASEGWSFDRMFNASFATIPHRHDVMTGRYGGPFHKWLPLRHDVQTLPRALAEAGYATQLIHDTPHLVNGGHNFDSPFHAWTPVRGAEVDRPWIMDKMPSLPNWTPDPMFDCLVPAESFDKLDWRLTTYAMANRLRKSKEDWNCARLFNTASQFVKDNAAQEKFFLWIDCFDPHEPWDAPPEFVMKYDTTPGFDGRLDPRIFWRRNDERLPEVANSRIHAQYSAKVSWMDHCLGKLLDTLEDTGLANNTAVLLTADHGTRLRERGVFGKGSPLFEQTGHIPLIVRTPEKDAGRTSMITQPQDLFATITALAGARCPDDLDSHDVLAHARAGAKGQRELALSGNAANAGWAQNDVIFTAFTPEHYLHVNPTLEGSSLYRFGQIDAVATPDDKVIEDLHKAALAELERRGTDQSLMAWLHRHGDGDFPRDARFFDGSPGPAGYRQYFLHLYGHEREWI